MAVIAAYVSKWTWDGDFPPWPPQPVYIYEISADGSWVYRGMGSYDADSKPYGYELSAPISPPEMDVERAPSGTRPQVVVASDGDKTTDTHRLVWAALPPDFDYASGSVYAGVDPAYGGVDDHYVHLYSYETGDLYFPATAVQAIDPLPTPFSGPGFPPRNLVLFAPMLSDSPPFWTGFSACTEIF